MSGQLDVVQIIREKISKKAYEVYELKGKTPGQEIENWLEGERLVFTELLFPTPVKKTRTSAKKSPLSHSSSRPFSKSKSKKGGTADTKTEKPILHSPFR